MNYGIPQLTLQSCAERPKLVGPLHIWGGTSRSTRAGTWAFYTDDWRFETLWRAPEKPFERLLPDGELFEPNYSVFEASPSAVAIWSTYRKRTIAAAWQQLGVNVWIDLCVAHRHMETSILGVPSGWQRFCTAGFDSTVDDLDYELAVARYLADHAPFSLAVYGGGAAVTAWCERHEEAIRIPHRSTGRKR